MKKLKAVLMSICALALSVCALAAMACGEPTGVKVTLVEAKEKLIVIRADSSYGALDDALKALKADGKISYEEQTGDYGSYITAIGGYTADATKNEFVAIYSTLKEMDGVVYSTTEYGSYEYDGKTLGSASFGASGMPLIESELYILAIATY